MWQRIKSTVLYKQNTVQTGFVLISITDTHWQLWQSPNCFSSICCTSLVRTGKGKKKHFCSTCTPQFCHKSYFLRVTQLQLLMIDCYVGLILNIYHHLLIFSFFFSLLRMGRGEEILFLTSPNQCSCTCHQICWPVSFPWTPHLLLNEQPSLYNLTTRSYPGTLHFHHHFMSVI